MKLHQLSRSVAAKEKRLAELGAEGKVAPALVAERIEQALAEGSLELAGIVPDVAACTRLRAARQAVSADAPFSLPALLAWHRGVIADGGRLRTRPREREGGPPSAPPEFLLARLQSLEHWLGVESMQELKPQQQGALALARLCELLPFDDGNGRVARLAAAHLMQRGGARPPLLRGADGERLRATLQAAFQLHTEPLAQLLEEAALRTLDLELAVWERG